MKRAALSHNQGGHIYFEEKETLQSLIKKDQ